MCYHGKLLWASEPPHPVAILGMMRSGIWVDGPSCKCLICEPLDSTKYYRAHAVAPMCDWSLAEDRGKVDVGGRYAVSFLAVSSLPDLDDPLLARLLYSLEHLDEASISLLSERQEENTAEAARVAAAAADVTREAAAAAEPAQVEAASPEEGGTNCGEGDSRGSTKRHPTFHGLKVASWKGAILNVSGTLDELADVPEDSENRAAAVGARYVIAVRLRQAYSPAPILVLAGIRYRGNLGTIVRSAVQSNRFESIIIVDPDETAPKVPGEKLSNNRVSPVDVDYYSMQNAPLIPITRVATLHEFMECHRDSDRKIVATALNDRSLDVYSDQARDCLNDPLLYLMMGCESAGLPDFVTHSDGCVSVEIPSLSASINVGCAFSIVLTCMILASR